jgi:hypothetical protein
LDEQAYLDQRKGKGGRSSTSSRQQSEHVSSSRKFMFTDSDSKNAQRQFKRPPQSSSSTYANDTQPINSRRAKRSRTPSPSPERIQHARQDPTITPKEITTTTSSTPLIITPHQMPATFGNSSSEPIMTRDELNKLNSKIVKSRLMGNEDEAVELEKEYKKQVDRFEAARNGTEDMVRIGHYYLPHSFFDSLLSLSLFFYYYSGYE